MTNLFAWRDTKPEKMKRAVDPIGPDNDYWLAHIAKDAGKIVCCWGVHGTHRERAIAFLDEPFWKKLNSEARLMSFGLTDNNQPKHPLMLRKLCQLAPLKNWPTK
jgi:hypothetical protein